MKPPQFGDLTEAHVVINGVTLSFGQAMTLRVTIGHFYDYLDEETKKELGPIGQGYADRAAEVMGYMTKHGPR